MRSVSCRSLAVLLVAGASACGEGPGALGPAGVRLELIASGLPALDREREGSYEAWVVDRVGGVHSAGRFQPGPGGSAQLTSPVGDGVEVWITVEPPGDADPAPSAQLLLRGAVRGRRADLGVRNAVTAADLPLRERPGQYTVFTPSDNAKHPFPSNENAGVWLFNSAPGQTEQGDHWVRLAPLREGWVYEGWMVRDPGTPAQVWLSYGKFRPDEAGVVNRRDENGWGPFSGVDDYRTAGLEDFPGDDWVANPFGFPVPGNLPLPIDLRERNPAGQHRWWHVITIEPAWDQHEEVSSERPFLLRPYRDRFVDTGIGRPRPISFDPFGVPSATVVAR